MPRNGTPRPQGVVDGTVKASGAQCLRAPAEGAHPGQHHARRAGGVVGIGDESGVGSEVDEGLLGGAEVADAVVEDGDASVHRHTPSALPNVPLVEGTPPPSTRSASRSARAVPLNDASRTWWVFLPVTRRRCNVIPDAVTKARQNSSASCGSNGGAAERRHVGSEAHVVGEIGPARDVERHLDERLVEGQGDRREAPDARLVPECLGQRLAEHDADVLHGVVGVDMEVARGLDREVEPSVASELGEHVVEERDPGLDLHRPRAVEDSSTSMAVSLVRRWRAARRGAGLIGCGRPGRAGRGRRRKASWNRPG